MCKLCSNCPFSIKATIGVVQDGLDALDEGLEPTCHEISGAGQQFMEVLPNEDHICEGFKHWQNGSPYF